MQYIVIIITESTGDDIVAPIATRSSQRGRKAQRNTKCVYSVQCCTILL